MSPNTSELGPLSYEIWQALSGSRLSQKRTDMIIEALRQMKRNEEGRRRELGQLRTENQDLRVHLRDRDRHIRNLEAQLMPYLRAAPEQAPLLQEVMPEA